MIESRSRFIQNQNIRITGERAGDDDDLLERQSQISCPRFQWNGGSRDASQRLAGDAVAIARRDAPTQKAILSEKYVFDDVAIGRDQDLLKDGGESRRREVGGTASGEWSAVKRERARVLKDDHR